MKAENPTQIPKPIVRKFYRTKQPFILQRGGGHVFMIKAGAVYSRNSYLPDQKGNWHRGSQFGFRLVRNR